MAHLKLAKLPDRTPIKITITVGAELNQDLQAYAEAYSEAYQADVEPINELIPYMLQDFLKSDRSFVRAKKEKQKGGEEACKSPSASSNSRSRPNAATPS